MQSEIESKTGIETEIITRIEKLDDGYASKAALIESASKIVTPKLDAITSSNTSYKKVEKRSNIKSQKKIFSEAKKVGSTSRFDLEKSATKEVDKKCDEDKENLSKVKEVIDSKSKENRTKTILTEINPMESKSNIIKEVPEDNGSTKKEEKTMEEASERPCEVQDEDAVQTGSVFETEDK